MEGVIVGEEDQWPGHGDADDTVWTLPALRGSEVRAGSGRNARAPVTGARGAMREVALNIRALAGRSALVLVSTLVILVVLEISLRLLTPPPPPPDDSLRTYTQYDPELGWRGRPDARGTYRAHGFLTDVTLNHGGWRDEEPEIPSRVPTVALVGDSFAWGFGVQRGEMFADRVEALLPGVRVQNYGVCGYGTDQELLVLEKSALAIHPRVVLVEFAVGNDLDNVLSSRAYGLPKPRYVPANGALRLEGIPVPRTEQWDRAARTGVRDFLTAHVRLFAWSRPRWANLRGRAERLLPFLREEKGSLRLALLDKNPSQRVERGWGLVEQILGKVAADADAAGARTVVLVVPDRTQVDAPLWNDFLDTQGRDPASYDRDLPDRRIQEIASRLGITVVDPLEAQRARAASGTAVFLTGDPHWNAAGHEIAAQELARALKTLL